jgi:DNA-binding CsgD family transcriptional regulator
MPEAMASDRFTVMLGVRSVEGFREELLRFTRWLGFDLVSAFVVVDRPVGEPEFLAVGNAPEAYLETNKDGEAGRRDPVMQHCKRYSTPIVWNQETYVNNGLAEMWEEQAAYGYRTGICLALHLPKGLHFAVGVDRDQELPRTPAEQFRMAADLCLFAAYAQQAALRLLVPQGGAEQQQIRLSHRELEVLRWTMAGKTAWEVGVILGINEQTVVRHLGHAAQKLGCVNKVQAVARALQLGLIA